MISGRIVWRATRGDCRCRQTRGFDAKAKLLGSRYTSAKEGLGGQGGEEMGVFGDDRRETTGGRHPVGQGDASQFAPANRKLRGCDGWAAEAGPDRTEVYEGQMS